MGQGVSAAGGHIERGFRAEGMYVPVDEVNADTETAREAVEGEATVGL